MAEENTEILEIRPRGHVINHTGSWLKASASILTTTTLPPILALSSALAALQWPAGIVILLFCSLGTFYCLWLLVQCTESEFLGGKRYDNFPALAVAITGKKYWGIVVFILQMCTNWGAGVASIIMASSFMNNFFVTMCTMNCDEMGVTLWTLVASAAAAALALLPNFSNRDALIIVSGSFTFIYSIIAIVLSFVNNKHNESSFDLVGSTQDKVFNAFNAIGVMFFLYGDTEYPELQSYLKSDANNSTAISMSRGMLVAFPIIIPLIALLGISGYWSFGNSVTPILLSVSFNPGWLVSIAIVMCILQLLVGVHMFAQPIYQHVEPAIVRKFPKWKWMQHRQEIEEIECMDENGCGEKKKKVVIVPSYLLMSLQRLLYIGSIALVAVIFNFFSAFIGVVGAVGIAPLTFLFPLAFHIITNRKTMSAVSVLFHKMLFVLYALGAIVALIGSVYSIVISFSTFKLQ